MVIYDSVSKRKRPFEPVKAGEARIYVCGPTVYDDAHLGHARSAVAFDLLRRTLKALGYKVTFVSNITDIDDKIIQKHLQSGESVESITEYYTRRFREDMSALGVLSPDIAPKATQSLDAIERMVQTLLEKGYAYQSDNGVWFDTAKDPDYCTLSHRCGDEEEARARIEHEEGKRHSRDFALWKACKTEDVCYDSALGRGRPGWHIECSAMIAKHLAYEEGEYQIDIHGGGADLFFPHHENESAQSRCASGRKLAKYWMHNGFVRIDGEKMSKSLGNSFFIKDALKIYDGESLRFYLLSTHYRADFNFNEEDLLSAKKRLDRLYRLKKRLYGQKVGEADAVFKSALLEALADDLNISKALAEVDAMITQANETLDNDPKNKPAKRAILGNINFLGDLLGIGTQDAYRRFQHGVDDATKEQIESLIARRAEAKKAKDFATADAIREELTNMGIRLMDTPNGTVWEKDETLSTSC